MAGIRTDAGRFYHTGKFPELTCMTKNCLFTGPALYFNAVICYNKREKQVVKPAEEVMI